MKARMLPGRIATVDHHTGGEPFRIVAEPPVRIRTTTAAHFGVLFWHEDGFSTACGHGTIALGVWAVDTGLVAAPETGSVDVVIDVPSGRVTARVHRDGGRTVAADFVNVPSWVVARDVPVTTSRGGVTVTVACGGAIYATLPAGQVGLTVTAGHLGELWWSRMSRPPCARGRRRGAGDRRGGAGSGDLLAMRDVVTGTVTPSRDRPLVFESVGMSWQDLVVAEAVCRAADGA